MQHFFKKALLPDKDADVFITSAEIDGAVKPFLPEKLAEGIRHHADITICHLGGKRFVTALGPGEYYKERIKNNYSWECIVEKYENIFNNRKSDN